MGADCLSGGGESISDHGVVSSCFNPKLDAQVSMVAADLLWTMGSGFQTNLSGVVGS